MSIKCWKIDVHDEKFKGQDLPEDLFEEYEEDRKIIKCKCGNILGMETTCGFIFGDNVYLNDCVINGICLKCKLHFQWRHTDWKSLSGME